MRDPHRIGDVLHEVETIWRRYPDMRLGQLLSNLADWAETSVWDLEEDVLVAEIERHLDHRKAKHELAANPDTESASEYPRSRSGNAP